METKIKSEVLSEVSIKKKNLYKIYIYLYKIRVMTHDEKVNVGRKTPPGNNH